MCERERERGGERWKESLCVNVFVCVFVGGEKERGRKESM